MGQHTPIEWADDTVNPTSGCDGCELYNPRAPKGAMCYARAIHEQRFALQGAMQRSGNYARRFDEVRTIAGRIARAARARDLTGTNRPGKPWLDGLPRCIFVGDLSDIFSRDVPDEFLEREVFAPMESDRGRRHVWMVLTKRPTRMAAFSWRREGGLPRNVIAMTSVTSQATAGARLDPLFDVRARWHGVSAEPLLGPVRLGEAAGWLDWLIIGGASGTNAVPCEVAWIGSLLKEGQAAGTATFVKQLGSLPVSEASPTLDQRLENRLRDRKGGDISEWPVELQVREMPAFAIQEQEVPA